MCDASQERHHIKCMVIDEEYHRKLTRTKMAQELRPGKHTVVESSVQREALRKSLSY